MVGIIGLGTVGTGVVRILQDNHDVIEKRLGTSLEIKKISDLDVERDRGLTLAPGILIPDAQTILNDPEIEIVVELIGGHHPAREFILEALKKGKHVVTANKALLAECGEDLFQAAEEAGVDLFFEASVGGGIPIIRILKEGLSANRIESIFGIINGTANFILTKMSEEEKSFEQCLAEAQQLGFAEADPTLDIEGIDSAHKLAILVMLAFGTPVSLSEIYTEGISKVSAIDIEFAKEFGYVIKLLAIAKGGINTVEARVHPTMVPKNYLIATVGGAYNAVYVQGDAVGKTLFYGRGAGDLPTGSAVVSDMMEIGRNILKGAAGRLPATSYPLKQRRVLKIKPIEQIESLYYLRFMAQDQPRVLSKISGILGDHSISISSVLQKGRKKNGAVPVVMMTHRAQEKNVQLALKEIQNMSQVLNETVLIRVEGEEE
jgi:homoserine dehydrogenase